MNIMKKLSIVIALPVVLLLSACSVQATSHTDTHASSAPKPSAAVQTDPLLKGFGETITYKDGISVSVSKPAPFTPSMYAAGVVQGQSDVLFNVVVTNHSKENLELLGFPEATSGGQKASVITDLGSNIGNEPTSALLPEQSITWQEGFSVADPTNITLQYRVNFTHEPAIFDSKH
jgi:hypothetical protein